MPAEPRVFYNIAIGLAVILLLCCVAMASGEENNRKIELNSSIENTTPALLPANDAGAAIAVKSPAIQAKALPPSAQRKISTNLLYILDSNIPEKGISREQAANAMKASGQMKTVEPESAAGPRAGKPETVQPATNEIFVYIDLAPSASTSVVDLYFHNMTNRNEGEHYIAGWINIDSVDQIASLSDVINIRPGEPSITKASPVYHDTKFVNKRAGLPPLTADEAKASVREFENAPGMALEQKRTMSTLRGEVYEMASDGGRYYVNAKTGDVELASFYGKNNDEGLVSQLLEYVGISKRSGSGPVTMDQAFSIAQGYARENYGSFNDRTMVLTESKLVDHGDGGKTYYFTWMEKVNGISIPNGVVVTIDAETGNVLSYIAIDQPVSADIVPMVSQNSVIATATSAFPSINVVKSNALLKVISTDDGTQKLVWSVDILGTPKNHIEQGGNVIIDAHTGDIVAVNTFA